MIQIKEQIKEKSEDQCPKCNSEDIEWGENNSLFTVDLVFRFGVCKKCGCNFYESYDLNYVNTRYDIREEI